MRKRKWLCLEALLPILLLLVLTGCEKPDADTRIVLTTGFNENEVFRIEDVSCTLPEIMLFLTNTQNRYENVYGKEIWQTRDEGINLEENVKEVVLAELAQLKTMKLLAQKTGVALEEEDLKKAGDAAEEYYGSLNDRERAAMGVTREIVENLYMEYALADKVYEHIIRDINPEISDDEARTITVQHILLKTYLLDGSGKKIEYSEEEKQAVYERADEILQLAREEDSVFEDLIDEYSEDETSTYSFGKGEMEESFEKAAFNLGKDEISDIVETSVGYHIIRCINTFNREQTDANKIKIVEKRREEVFGQEYEEFVDTLTKNLNEELWKNVTFIHDDSVTTATFFELYEKYFSVS